MASGERGRTHGVAADKAANGFSADALESDAAVLKTFIDDLEELPLLGLHSSRLGTTEVEELGVHGVQVDVLQEHTAGGPHCAWLERAIVVALDGEAGLRDRMCIGNATGDDKFPQLARV